MGIPAGESRNNAVPNGNIANLNQECMHSSLNAQPKEMSTSPEPLAVVGLALKFPQGAHNTEAFWKLLLEKRSALTKVPEGRYNADAFDGAREGHFIREELGAFDAPFFSISPSEAENMDPQQRWLLETTYQALENAGITMNEVKKTQTSVHVGNFTHDFEKLSQLDSESKERFRVTGTSMSILANRISWFYDLEGPSMVVDTACSSSLVAFHLACQELRAGNVDMGVVAGVNLLFDPSTTDELGNFGFLSPDNKCYSFDHRANGYSRGEGIGVVLVKRLSKALEDGNAIRAIIRGSGSNQDGRTPGITQPSGTAQTNLIRAVYKRAGLDMSATQYFEAHGTGTAVGDPTEARAITNAFNLDREQIYVGAVKSNIGHLEGASGIAGLIKAILVLERGLIPANMWFERINPAIDAEAWRLRFPKDTVAWPSSGLRRASVNSFGFGGTNAHVILDDAEHYLSSRGLTNNASQISTASEPAALQQNQSDSQKASISQMIFLTAFDEAGIDRLTTELMNAHLGNNRLSGSRYLEDVAYTLNEKRTKLPWRSFAIAASNQPAYDLAFSEPVRASNELKLCFVFTGQGAQWRHMGQELLRFEVFKRSIDRAEIFLSNLGCYWSITEMLFMDYVPENAYGDINDARYSQPLCTIVQVALVNLLESWGVSPTVVVGHSSGEIAAAYCSKSISEEMAWKFAYYRGLAVSETQRPGSVKTSMMSVSLSPEKIRPFLSLCNQSGPSHDHLTIACYNSPNNVTVSGVVDRLDMLEPILEENGVLFRRLKVDVAYHSSHMNEAADVYRQYLRIGYTDLTHNKGPRFISTVTETEVGPDELQSADYWVANLVSPVRFSNVVQTIFNPKRQGQNGTSGVEANFIVELGPHSTLASPLKQIFQTFNKNLKKVYTSALVRNQSALQSVLNCVGSLSCSGHTVSLAAVNKQLGQSSKPRLVTTLPPYPFNHSQSYWNSNRLAKSFRFRNFGQHKLLGVPVPDWNALEARWNNKLILKEMEFLSHHIVNGVKIYPAAGMLVMAIEASRQLADPKAKVTGFRFKDVTFTSALPLSDSASGTETQLFLRPAQERTGDTLRKWDEFRLCVWENDSWHECCRGAIATEYAKDQWTPSGTDESGANMTVYEAERSRILGCCKQLIEKDAVYNAFEEMGLKFGPTFQGLDHIRLDNTGSATAQVDLQHWKAADPDSTCQPHLIHPAALDAVLHLAIPAMTGAEGLSDSATIVPTHFKSLWISSEIGRGTQTSLVDVCVGTQKAGLRENQACLVATSKSTGRVELTCDATMMTVDRTVRNTVQNLDPTRRYFKVDWHPDTSFLDGSNQVCLSGAAEKDVASTPDIEFDLNLKKEWLCLSVMTTAIYNLPETYKVPKPYLQRYVDWMKHKLSVTEDNFDRYRAAKECAEANPLEFHEMVRNADIEGFVITKIADNMPKILSGAVDPLQLLFDDDSLQQRYNRDWAMGPQTELKNYIQALCHKTPGLRILEVGAGTGGMTSILLEGIDRDSYLSEYTYTDISPSFFLQAKERFGKHNITYKTLDVTKDLESQGFQLGHYDVVAASNILHATEDLTESLKNCRRLLRPDGKLLLHEYMYPENILAGMIFGLLPGWWLSSEEIHRWSPLQSRTDWHQSLLTADFSGEDMLLARGNVTNLETSRGDVMVSTAVSSSQQNVQAPSTPIVTIIYDQASDAQCELCKELQSQQNASKKKTLIHCLPMQTTHNVDLSQSIVVFLPALDTFSLSRMSPEDFTFIQAVCAQTSRMIWVNSAETLEHSMTVGFARAIESENLDFNFVTLTIESSSASRIADYVWRIINEAPTRGSALYENEYQERNGVLHIPRTVEAANVTDMVYLDQLENRQVTRQWGDDSGALVKLGLESVGLLDTLTYEEVEPWSEELKEGEVEVQVLAVGLNFVDVLTALGQTKNDYIGHELAGIVTRVPSNGAVSLRVGDVVIGCHNGTMATRIRCKAWQLHLVPPNLSVIDAAALPLVYCTVYYSMVTWARAQPGESILIHSGAGGVGQAAIQLAQVLGLKIFTTTSSDEKANLLMDTYNIPKSHIFSSRSLDFADGIRTLTNGVGVDIVLNSLSGEALKESFNLTARFGRFIELGKRDIHSTGTSSLGGLPMHTFSKNVMFASVDLPSLYLHGDRISGVLTDVVKLAADGKIKPPAPTQVFPAGETEQAFRLMQSGKNTGKIVIDYSPSNMVTIKKMKRKHIFGPDATYVIAGGLGGIARSICKWMVQKGARNLILLSRSAPSEAQVKDFLQPIRESGATVVHHPCDIADASRLEYVLELEKNRMPPVKGCIQTAMVLQNFSFGNMTLDQWNAAVRPKVDGSWNLHSLLPKGMDFFVLLSSHSGIIGAHGQSNYSAGNTYQDGLAQYRARQGERAVAIDLGRVPDVGYVANNEDVVGSALKLGLMDVTETEIMSLLEHYCDSGTHSLDAHIVTPLSLPAALEAKGVTEPAWLSKPIFRHLHHIPVDSQTATGEVKTKQSWQTLLSATNSLAEGEEIVREAICKQLADLLAIGEDDVDASKPVYSYGVDSLVAVELKNWFSKSIGADVPVLELLGNVPITSLACNVAKKSCFLTF